jgi:hypothetical protein
MDYVGTTSSSSIKATLQDLEDYAKYWANVNARQEAKKSGKEGKEYEETFKHYYDIFYPQALEQGNKLSLEHSPAFSIPGQGVLEQASPREIEAASENDDQAEEVPTDLEQKVAQLLGDKSTEEILDRAENGETTPDATSEKSSEETSTSSPKVRFESHYFIFHNLTLV